MALEIIRDREPCNARSFSLLMWPDAEGHKTLGSCGYGVTAGVGMWKAAGSFLGRLEARGFIRGRGDSETPYRLTANGEQALADWEKERLI